MQHDRARIVVVGSSCAGKTTFARRLARLLDVPHIELDTINWLPNWVARPPQEFRTLVAQAIAQEGWVIDGNYNTARDLIWPRATMVVWLNYPFALVLWRAVTRTMRRSLRHEELFSGNRETLQRAFFSRESILWWVLTTFHTYRTHYQELFNDPAWAQLARVMLRSSAAAERFLDSMSTPGQR